jgi:hypothetical protein
MKYLIAFLMIIGLVVLGAAGLAVGSWFFSSPSPSLVLPPTIDAGLLPTPTPVAAVIVSPPAIPTEAAAFVGDPPAAGDPFTGTFAGTMTGSDGSSAPVNLELVQMGDNVSGIMQIGQGLVIDGGNCGRQAVPPGMQTAAGRTDPANANHLEAAAVVEVQGMTITILLSADLAADGRTLTSQATIDLPFICGPDPVITGALTRQS